MKFHLTRSGGRNLFTGYGAGYVSINEQRYEHPIVVTPENAVMTWEPASFDGLTAEHFEALLDLKPEIVILGTGESLRFPHPRLTRPLAEARVGFEAMDTKAACRTFNILMAEGRQVVAAMLVNRS
jgi:uncharacterized protein